MNEDTPQTLRALSPEQHDSYHANGNLQAIILCKDGGDDFSDITYPPETGDALAAKFGPQVLDEMAKIGITFDSETD